MAESHPLSFTADGDAEAHYNVPFTMAEFCSALGRCRDGAPGPDGLSYPMIRHFHPTAVSFLLALFNWVWLSDRFPDLWCQPTVIPIPKPRKDHSLPGEFRPISLTSCVCKLLEWMVAERLVWVLEDIQGLSPLQFEFRRFCSTANPLL